METDAEGLLWVGNWGVGIDVRDASGQWQHLNTNNSVLEGIKGNTFAAISDIDRDANGLMWIANVQNGLVVMDGWPPQRATLNSQLDFGMSAGRDMTKIAIGPNGLKWVGTALDGFFLLDDGGTPFEIGDETGLAFDTASYPSLTSDTVSDIHVDRSGRVWVATNNGLNAVRGEYSRPNAHFAVESWKVYNADNGLPNTAVTSLAEDYWGRIWVGTEGGLVRIDTEGQVEFALDTSDGLVNNRVNSLYFDRENDALWIGTLAGMSRLQLRRLGSGCWPSSVRVSQPLSHRRARRIPDLCRPAAGRWRAHFHRTRANSSVSSTARRAKAQSLGMARVRRVFSWDRVFTTLSRRLKPATRCAANSP